VYQVSNSTALLRAHRRLLARDRFSPRVARTVVLLGLTSLITDISSEMVVTVLPLYLIYVGGFSPLAFGVVDGVYNGATALVGLASGFIGDRWGRHKEVAATGYGLSAVCKLLLATAGTALSTIGAVVLFDRVGKGIRTAPRDTMISLSTPKRQLGTAFGVHRALDTTGALLGPLLAFGLLAMAPLAFNSVFLVSFCLAIVGVGIIVLFVDPKDRAADAAPPTRPPSLRGALALLHIRRYRGLLFVGGALSLATASDAFIFLAVQDKLDFRTSLFPRLRRPRARAARWLHPAAWRLRRAAASARRFAAAGRRARDARHLLRRHRRRPDGAQQHRRARGGPRQRPRPGRYGYERRPLDRLRRLRLALGAVGHPCRDRVLRRGAAGRGRARRARPRPYP
jgi:MFS family permease